MSMGLTPRQARALSFIKAYLIEHDGVAPTVAEIGTGLGLRGSGTAHGLLVSLRLRGAIDWDPNSKRSIRVLPDAIDFTAWLEGLTDQEFANAEAVMKDVSFRRRRDRTLARTAPEARA